MKNWIKPARKARGGKTLASPQGGNGSDHFSPIFSFAHIQKSHCLSDCEKEEKAALADTLHKLSQKTWRELRQSHKHGIGFEKIACNSVRPGKPAHLTDDVTHYLAFRFSGMKAMVGHRSDKVFQILWLDRNFSLYDHGS